MIVRNLTEGNGSQSIQEAAKDVGVQLYHLRKEGTGFRFTLRLNGKKYRRLSHTGRKVAAVCWHGHYDFMAMLFKYEPDAILISMIERYDGKQAFHKLARQTGYQNIGNEVHPLMLKEACTC